MSTIVDTLEHLELESLINKSVYGDARTPKVEYKPKKIFDRQIIKLGIMNFLLEYLFK